jgi:NAD(P)-dependent dehydrogenase (short-subunit alcohol dehydrogenase family)
LSCPLAEGSKTESPQEKLPVAEMGFLYSQLCQSLPYPSQFYVGKTVVVTGSNVGLGKEAARHFARLGASTVVLAVRNVEKGQVAADDIIKSTGRPKSTIQVWRLDMSSHKSIEQFVERAKQELERIDIFLANSGVASTTFRTAADNEEMVTVNFISTFLLVLLIMPKLKETAQKFSTKPTLSITSSEVHGHTNFPEKAAPEGRILSTLADQSKANMAERYPVSKLLGVFCVRAFATRYPSITFPVTLNCVNPGLCHS